MDRMNPADEQAIVQQLLKAKRVAVVGLSDSPIRPSYGVASYLIRQGYDVVPVNPKCQSVFGRPSYRSLREVPGPIDLVNVFRRAEQCPPIVAEAIEVGAKGIWLQLGIRSPESRQLAEAAGVPYVEDRCIKIDHALVGR